MSWLSGTLLALALVESLVLARFRPKQVRLASSGVSLLLHFSKRWVMSPLGVLLQSHFLGIFFFTKILSIAWPYRINTVSMSAWWAWPLLFLAADFLYYWEHRFKHSIRFFWANHAVHHSARHLNLAEAYRLGWTGWITANVFFYVPLVLIGFSPANIFWMLMIQQVYQLLTHLDWVPKLGWLEYVFVTPSGHRAHHGTNQKYLNRNFGGVFIVFDRLFGTYVEETERPRYGLVTPFESLNPIAILFCGWRELVVSCAERFRKHGIWNMLVFAFGPVHHTEAQAAPLALPQAASLASTATPAESRRVS